MHWICATTKKTKLPHSRPKNVQQFSCHSCSGHILKPKDKSFFGLFTTWWWSPYLKYDSLVVEYFICDIHDLINHVFDNEEESPGQSTLREKRRTLLSKAPWEAKDIVVLCLGSFISPKSDLESSMNNFKWSISSYLWTKICYVNSAIFNPWCGFLHFFFQRKSRWPIRVGSNGPFSSTGSQKSKNQTLKDASQEFFLFLLSSN